MPLSLDIASSNHEERQFGFEELFFSRTNESGIILSGNQVFQRVSGYAWNEMMRKPHKLIRHPDMPRAVFWLLWDTIKKGAPIGAYVKNRAKDGRYYWVFAIVTPADGGYLSVRVKPSSDLFTIVKREYASLVAAENRDKIDPAASARRLLGRLSELGFDDYGSFMATALSKELDARDKQLGRTGDGVTFAFENLVASARSLLERTSAIFDFYSKIKFSPLNFQIQALQLGRSGASIGEVSSNYKTISADLKTNMERFSASANRVFQTISEGMFLVCTAKVQQELLDLFRNEPASVGVSQEREGALLDQQRQAYRQKAIAGLHTIAKQAEHFRQDCEDMRRTAASLEVTRIMGKVECARLTTANDEFQVLLDELKAFQQSLASGLREITQLSQGIRRNTEKLLVGARAWSALLETPSLALAT
jgi:PAS domain S-box-containing protein